MISVMNERLRVFDEAFLAATYVIGGWREWLNLEDNADEQDATILCRRYAAEVWYDMYLVAF